MLQMIEDLYNRTYNFGRNFFREFFNKSLLGGTITDIGTYFKSREYPEVHITIEYDDEYFSTHDSKVRNIYYDITTDSYNINNEEAIERKDSVLLAKIASKINPNTKYKETGKNFKIKGW